MTITGWNFDPPGYAKGLTDQTVAVGASLTYVLPSTQDGDGDYVVVIAYTKTVSGATSPLPYYALLNDGTAFSFNPLLNSDVGSIVIYVDLHDDNHEP